MTCSVTVARAEAERASTVSLSGVCVAVAGPNGVEGFSGSESFAVVTGSWCGVD